MKKSILFLLAAILLVSCDPQVYVESITSDFEEFELGDAGYFDGSNKTGALDDEGVYVSSIASGSAQFLNRYTYNEEWDYGFWEGFAVSSLVDVETPGFVNQYSAIAGSGAGNSKQFAVAYDSAEVILPVTDTGYQTVQSIMLTNSTYAYLDMKEGSSFSKKFAEGDWFKVVITAYLQDAEVGVKEFYLADFRDGKSTIVKSWTALSLKDLGQVDKLVFTFDSSDVGDYGINTPKYVCVDDLVATTVGECGTCSKR